MLICLLVASALAASAQAFPPPGIDEGYTGQQWHVDFNGDGKLDYCRERGNRPHTFIGCLLQGSLKEVSSGAAPSFDLGYDSGGRGWVRLNSDKDVDFCRVVGDNAPGKQQLACTLSQGNAFGATLYGVVSDWGYPDTRRWAQADEHGPVEFCRGVGDRTHPTTVCSTVTTNKNGGLDIK